MLGKNVTLLGGTGFVGRAILNVLSKAGYRTTVLARRPERHRDLLLFPNTSVAACGNYKDATSFAKYFKGQDIVINLTTDPLTGSESIPVEALVTVNQSIKKAIESSSVKRVLTLSQIGADATQVSDIWLRALGEVEALMLTLANTDNTILQTSLLIGEYDDTTTRYQAQLKLLPILPIANGNITVQPLWVKDFAQAMVSTIPQINTGQQRLIAAGEERLTLKALGETVAELMGRTDALVFNMCHFNAKLMSKLGRLAPIRSVTDTQLLRLNHDLITQNDFMLQFGFEPVCLEHALSTYIVPHSLRARYNFLRREAGRDASDLALLDLEDPLQVP